MALGTVTKVAANSSEAQASAPLYFDAVSLAGDASYVTGGTVLSPAFQACVGDLRKILAVIPLDLCGGYEPIYDASTDKLVLRVSSSGVEAAGGDYHATTLKLLVISC
jgi:hypothetical protein